MITKTIKKEAGWNEKCIASNEDAALDVFLHGTLNLCMFRSLVRIVGVIVVLLPPFTR